MAAIRREAILHYGAPRWLGNWVNRPRSLPLLLLLPCLLLGLAAWVRGPLEKYFSASYTPNHIIISYWSQLPQRLLIVLFGFLALLDALVVGIGVTRFWRDLKACDRDVGRAGRRQSLTASIRSAARSIILHEDFDRCIAGRPRMNSHRLVLFGFVGLLVVDLWVLTVRLNPLISDSFLYPFNFWSPWKMLANVAGMAILIGCTLMLRERMDRTGRTGAQSSGTEFTRTSFARTRSAGTWFDWAFLGLAMAAVLTGFGCEILHYARVDPLRYGTYVIHLATVFALLVLLPYSKFAHMIYRATAMVYAARTGRQPLGGLDEAE